MVAGVAQRLERQAVALKVAGSSPAARPISLFVHPQRTSSLEKPRSVNGLGGAVSLLPALISVPLLDRGWQRE